MRCRHSLPPAAGTIRVFESRASLYFAGLGRVQSLVLIPLLSHLVFQSKFELLQADLFNLVIFRKVGFVQQTFEHLSVGVVFLLQAAYFYAETLSIDFYIHADTSTFIGLIKLPLQIALGNPVFRTILCKTGSPLRTPFASKSRPPAARCS